MHRIFHDDVPTVIKSRKSTLYHLLYYSRIAGQVLQPENCKEKKTCVGFNSSAYTHFLQLNNYLYYIDTSNVASCDVVKTNSRYVCIER